jgi:hypothetical protein
VPDQPSWIGFVPQILRELEAPGSPPFLDRPAVEALFGVRRRQAIELLRRFGGYQIGKTFLAPREAVVRFLRDPERWPAVAGEKARFARVLNALGAARTELDQRRIPIPRVAERQRGEISGLPPGIRLEAGQLTVQFATPVELLEKLFALSQILTNDYEAFERQWSGG